MRKPLSSASVAKLKRPGHYAVGDGCYLQIAAGGTRSWVLRFTLNGRSRYMGLGPYSLVSLAEARARARDARRLLLDKIDPIEARRAAHRQRLLEMARGKAFRECAEAYIAAHEAGWRDPRSHRQWVQSLTTYVYPHLGDLSVAAIDTGLVVSVLEPIWKTKPETATRVRGRIESVLDWAKVRGLRDGENPARWRGHLDHLLPARSKVQRVKHFAALPYAELPALMAKLRDRQAVSAAALEFLILAAARTNEVLGARWDEIDSDVWTVPAERMKGGREHRVPLSAPAVAILRRRRALAQNDLVFPSRRPDRPLHNTTTLRLMRAFGIEEATPHGFRSSFRDWIGEKTSFPHEVAEMALAHAIQSKVEAAYRRGDLFERRREMMDRWGDFCVGAASVVPLRKPV
jgi:integrase